VICCGMAVKRMGDVRCKCEKDRGPYCEDGDSDSDW